MQRTALILLLLAGVCGFTAGCGPSAMDGGFDSPNPAARMYAIEQAARSGDTSAIPDIVPLLDSDDPAVRLLAISALERLTGRTLGYRYHDDPATRRESIQRWFELLDEQMADADGASADRAAEFSASHASEPPETKEP